MIQIHHRSWAIIGFLLSMPLWSNVQDRNPFDTKDQSTQKQFKQDGSMKMRRFKQNKLWRDKLIERMEKLGSRIHWTRLNDAEFAQELKTKFLEEAQEVYAAQTKKELIEELADVLEVISSFSDVHRFTLQDIIDVQNKKREDRGSFQGRRFVTVADHPEGSLGEKYCLDDPYKYPEIIN